MPFVARVSKSLMSRVVFAVRSSNSLVLLIRGAVSFATDFLVAQPVVNTRLPARIIAAATGIFIVVRLLADPGPPGEGTIFRLLGHPGSRSADRLLRARLLWIVHGLCQSRDFCTVT